MRWRPANFVATQESIVQDADGLEVELKLQVAPGDLGAVAASLTGSGAKLKKKALHATYFDTQDTALREAGLSLRIRRSGIARMQTMKAEGAAIGALLARPEWERPATSDEPDLADAPEAIRALLPASLERVAPAFGVEVTRRSGTIEHDGSTAEIAIDAGTVIAGGRSDAIAEIELELKEGSPAALFSLARDIAAHTPVRLGMLTKSERGYRLLDGSTDKPSKGERAAIPPNGTVADAFQAIARACLRQFRLNEDLLLATESPDALHQARVAIRRLRSAFSIFKSAVADSRYQHLRRELRWLAALLGEARDIDVLIARTGEHDRLRSARADAYARVFEGLASPQAAALGLDLAEWLAIGTWRTAPAAPLVAQPAIVFATATLTRLRRRLKRQGKRLGKLDDEARHRVRIQAKKLRYAAEFFAPLYPGGKRRRRARRFIAAMQDLQGHLGELNDLATAPLVLARLDLPPLPAAAADRSALIGAAADAFDALMERKRFWR